MRLMTTSDRGRQLIKRYEGLRLSAYVCPAGRLTIGWGHTRGVCAGQRITEQQAEAMLTADTAPIEQLLNALGINFRQEQFDALVSWIFNLGYGNFSHSTLLKRIQAGASDEEIADQMVRWTFAGGRQLRGLMERRVSEANTFVGRERYRVEGGKIVKTAGA